MDLKEMKSDEMYFEVWALNENSTLQEMKIMFNNDLGKKKWLYTQSPQTSVHNIKDQYDKKN